MNADTWMVLVIPFSVIGFAFIYNLIISKKDDWQEQEEINNYYRKRYNTLLRIGNDKYEPAYVWSPFYSFEDNNEGQQRAKEAMEQRVLDMPQLTFERWLNFYNNKPQAWVIQTQQFKTFADIPYYQKPQDNTYIPVFWASPEDMRKYREWVESKFEQGHAAIYEQERDKNMTILVDQVKEDLQEKRNEFEKQREEALRPVLDKPTGLTLKPFNYDLLASSSYILEYQGKKVCVHTDKNALDNPQEGAIFYDVKSNECFLYHNNKWNYVR